MNTAVMERALGGEGSLDVIAALARKQLSSGQPNHRRSIGDMIADLRLIEGGAITASGYYGLTLEKQLIDTIGLSMESESAVKVLMVTDSEAPNFDTHDFRNDITAEVTGTGYTAGGNTLTTTEITLASGVLTYDAADVAWAASTIANAMAAVGYFARGGASSADELIWLSDFVTAASTTNGTFTIQWNASGIFTIDYTP
jgi:hypothetical protein